jgi:hypothetical protein
MVSFVVSRTSREAAENVKQNGVSKQVESVVQAVMEELQARSESGSKAARDASGTVAEKVRDADVADKVDRLINFIEENASVLAEASKRVAGDVAKEAPVAAAAVGEAASSAAMTAGEAIGAAAESAGEAMGELIEALGEEVIQPTVKYGRGLRHGLLIGATIAILYTPWPGAIVRQKLKSFAREAMELVDAVRAGAADAGA